VIPFTIAILLGTNSFGQVSASPSTDWTEIKATVVGFEVKEITVKADGTATYSFRDCATFKKQPLQKIKLSKKNLDALNKVIGESDVSSLPSSVGRFVYSLTPCDLHVKAKQFERDIRLLCPHDPMPASKLELDQERRARRIWQAMWDLEPLFVSR
jgi:hypothetical protein